MPSYTDPFGGSTIQAAQVAYRAVALSSSQVTVWPPFATADNYLARIMDVTPSAGSLTITLPDATLQSQGWDVFFTNKGAQTYTVLDAAGGTVMTVAAGQVKYIYLTSNTTAAGAWSVVVMGVGSSNLDAAALAGYGLVAITSTLNAASEVVEDSTTPRTIDASDRAKTYVWTGGAGAYTLPLVATATDDFYFEVRNQGTGVLTLTPTGGELIDSSASIALQLNESAIIHSGPTAWYTVGRGRNTQFNFTQLVKTVTGGTTTLSLTEAANVVQTYTGALLSNQIIVVPGVVQVYYIRNQTTGSFNFRVQSPAPGAVVDLPSGTNAILFCDGVNVYDATTYVATVTNFPPITISARSSNTILGISDRGTMLEFTGTFTQTLTAAATLASGWYVDYQNLGTGVITFDANGAETFNTPSGARTTINIYPGETGRLVCNGTSFDTPFRPQRVLAYSLTASGAASVDLEQGFDDTEAASIDVEYSQVTGSSDVRGLVKKGGSYLTTGTYGYGYVLADATAGPQQAGTQNYFFLNGQSNGALRNGKVSVSRPTDAARQQILADTSEPLTGFAISFRQMGGLFENTASALQGLRFVLAAGNISGSFWVWINRG